MNLFLLVKSVLWNWTFTSELQISLSLVANLPLGYFSVRSGWHEGAFVPSQASVTRMASTLNQNSPNDRQIQIKFSPQLCRTELAVFMSLCAFVYFQLQNKQLLKLGVVVWLGGAAHNPAPWASFSSTPNHYQLHTLTWPRSSKMLLFFFLFKPFEPTKVPNICPRSALQVVGLTRLDSSADHCHWYLWSTNIIKYFGLIVSVIFVFCFFASCAVCLLEKSAW